MKYTIITVTTREIETQEQMEKLMYKLTKEGMPNRCLKSLGLKGPAKWVMKDDIGEQRVAVEIVDLSGETVGAA